MIAMWRWKCLCFLMVNPVWARLDETTINVCPDVAALVNKTKYRAAILHYSFLYAVDLFQRQQKEMGKEGNCQSHICTWLCLTLSFMSNHYHSQEKPLVFSASCLLITAKELGEDTRNKAIIKEMWYLSIIDTFRYWQCHFGIVGRRQRGVELGSTW